MQQVIPGVYHWTAVNQASGARGSSYLIASGKVVIDPHVPAEGLDALPERPERVLLSSGHHLRDAHAYAERFGIPMHASPQAVAHLGAAGHGVTAWPEGTAEVASGITALHIGVLAADEGALHIDTGPGALLLADAVHHDGSGLAFFPDSLLGEDPDAVKQGLRAALAALVDSLDFDALLLAHGEPLASGGADALRAFTERGEGR